MTHARAPYADRTAAGQVLAGQLTQYAGRTDVVVLALPRGGVPVAVPVAQALHAPLDVLVVRKLGVPSHPELAMGAIAGVGDAVEVVRNQAVIRALEITDREFEAVGRHELTELHRRDEAYRQGRPVLSVHGQTVILVDDGLATGSTARAAIAAVRRQGPRRIVLAVPVGGSDTCAALRLEVDEVVCSWTPHPFHAVAQGYADFRPTDDEQVREGLQEAAGIDRRRTPR